MLTASLGFPARPRDPLVDPNSLFLFPGQRATVTVRVASVNSFQGQVKLIAGCCDDLLTGAPLPNALHREFPNDTGPNGVFVNVPPPSLRFQFRGFVSSVDAVLEIRADSTAVPRRLLINLKAETGLPGVSASAGIAAEILPPVPPDSGTVPACVSQVIVGSSSLFTAWRELHAPSTRNRPNQHLFDHDRIAVIRLVGRLRRRTSESRRGHGRQAPGCDPQSDRRLRRRCSLGVRECPEDRLADR
jgi:hypothetical protein